MVLNSVGLLFIWCVANSNANTGNFDFYILALSWSPDYCAANGVNDSQQCGSGKKLGFVLHGLWPQYNRGYPSDCTAEKLPASVKSRFSGLYPSEKLIEHEWSKHGTCSGLTPEQYFSLSQKLKESVIIPAAFQAPAKPVRVTTAQFKEALVTANSALRESAFAVYCSGSGRFLKDVFVCFTRDGKPTACSRELQMRAARSCQRSDFLVRNVR